MHEYLEYTLMSLVLMTTFLAIGVYDYKKKKPKE